MGIAGSQHKQGVKVDIVIRARRKCVASVSTIALAAFLPLGLVARAQAETYNVTNEAELRAAITAANANSDPNAVILLNNDIGLMSYTALPAGTKPITIDTNGHTLSGFNSVSIGSVILNSVNIANSGTLQGGNATSTPGSGGNGLQLTSGTVTNIGTMRGGNSIGVGSGGGGLVLTNGVLTNTGTIIGGNGGTSSGSGGIGARLIGGSHVNNGTIRGGGAAGSGGAGSGVELETATLINNGLIESGTASFFVGEGVVITGSGDTALINNGIIRGRSEGISVRQGNVTIINNNLIESGQYSTAIYGRDGSGKFPNITLINDGTIRPGYGQTEAIRFSANADAVNVLELRSKSVIEGNVLATAAGAHDTLRLGGSANANFDVSQIGATAKYRNFDMFEKTGASTWTLTGTSFFAGPTTVQAGHLAVNGSLASSDVTVKGGSLGGSGAVGGIVVESGGTVAPGNASINTLNASRNVLFKSGSTYEVNVSPSQADMLWANGTATLSGGRVKVLAEGGSYQPSTPYTILKAAGGLMNTTFAGVTSNFAYLDPSLSYTANDVILTLTRKTVPTDPTDPDPPPPLAFSSVAVTPNQISVANAVEALGVGNTLFDAVIGQSVGGAQIAFDSLSGDAHWYTSYLPEVIGQAIQIRLLEHMRPPLITRDTLVNQPLDTYQPRTYTAAYAADKPGAAVQPVAVTLPRMAAAPRYAFWGEGFGSWGNVDGNGNAAGLDSATGGFVLGADARLDQHSVVGLAGGFARTTFDVDARLSSGSTDSIFASLYGATAWGNLSLRLGASYAWNDIDVSRSIRFPGFSDSTHASYDGFTALAFAELGYRVDLGAVQLEPFVGASLLRLHSDGFQEEGGAAALTGYAQDQNLATTTLGLRAEARISQDLPLTVRGLLGWRHTFGDVAPESLLAFAGGESPFTVQGTPLDRDVLVAEAGLDWHASEAISLGIAYSGQVSERAQEHAVKGSFTWRFGTR